jgi:hypothetical protein
LWHPIFQVGHLLLVEFIDGVFSFRQAILRRGFGELATLCRFRDRKRGCAEIISPCAL